MTVKTYLPLNTDIDSAMDVVAGIGAAFAVHAQESPDMTVRVDGGRLLDDDGTMIEVAAQNTGTITAPSTNPRNDIVYLDPDDGTIGVVTGTEAASPVDPAVPEGTLPVGRIRLVVSITIIINIDIDDCRIFPPPSDFFRKLVSEIKTGDYAVDNRDAGKMLIANKATAIEFDLSAVSSLRKGFVFWAKNIGAGTLTLDPNSTETIDGSSTVTLAQGESTLVFVAPSADSTDWRTLENVGSGGGGGGGKILQVVTDTKTDTFSTTSTSFVDVTGLSASITPASTSNKVLVIARFDIGMLDLVNQAHTRLVRDSTAIAIGDAAGSRTRASTMGGLYALTSTHHDGVIVWLDEPATTSATTYKIQMRVSASTGYVNRSGADSDAASHARTASSIVLMEVDGT